MAHRVWWPVFGLAVVIGALMPLVHAHVTHAGPIGLGEAVWAEVSGGLGVVWVWAVLFALVGLLDVGPRTPSRVEWVASVAARGVAARVGAQLLVWHVAWWADWVAVWTHRVRHAAPGAWTQAVPFDVTLGAFLVRISGASELPAGAAGLATVDVSQLVTVVVAFGALGALGAAPAAWSMPRRLVVGWLWVMMCMGFAAFGA